MECQAVGPQRIHTILDAVLVAARLIAGPWAAIAAEYLPAFCLWQKSALLAFGS